MKKGEIETLPLFEWQITRKEKRVRDLKVILVFLFFGFGLWQFFNQYFPDYPIMERLPTALLIACSLIVLGIIFAETTSVQVFEDSILTTQGRRQEKILWTEVAQWEYRPSTEGYLSSTLVFTLKKTFSIPELKKKSR